MEGTVAKDPTTGKPWQPGTPNVGPAYYNNWLVRKKDKDVESGEEWVSKIVVKKYGNKELLADLKKLNVITDIKGWSLVLVQATLENVSEVPPIPGDFIPVLAGPIKVYLSHKTNAPILLDDYIRVIIQGGIAFKANSKKLVKFNAAGVPANPALTHAVTGKGLGAVLITLGTYEETEEEGEPPVAPAVTKFAQVSGLFSGGEKLATLGPDKALVILSTASKIAGMGVFIEPEFEMETVSYSLAEGGVTWGAGVAKNVFGYPDVTVEVDPLDQ